jgi:hypothetical protein
MEVYALQITLTRHRILAVNACQVLALLEQNVTVSNVQFCLSAMLWLWSISRRLNVSRPSAHSAALINISHL